VAEELRHCGSPKVCSHNRRAYAVFSYKTDPSTNQVLPILEDKKNHVIDALRYACEAIRRANPVTPARDFVPLPTANRW
jgi:hypothetical protein